MEKTQPFKYALIKNDIVQAIKTKQLNADDKILSEAKLCKKYNVSRITVTRAINELVAEDYLYRIQGKGTFVKGKQLSEGVSQLSSFTKRMKEKKLKLETRVLETASVTMPVKMASFFNLPSDKNVILLKRLRIVDGELLCLSIAYLMPEIFYWTTLEDMEHESLYDLLENKYDFKLGNATQEFEVGYLNEKNAKFLEISSQDPCLKLSLYSTLSDGRPAQFEETYYIGSKYAYQLLLPAPHSFNNVINIDEL
ncbi:GntR family transcriptional regulator [Enterococcus raffinosus]|uniref:GntR family transcriptional regulator n=1 Tax=Enterococcus raffinosus TaxID=71452 RepID=UPI001C107FD0|nr:GntR family transcriptional regulator [Enterococcus raffinosus]MBU5360508.1 GntR family transcriptional regulator [Enterococcus raffinosus]